LERSKQAREDSRKILLTCLGTYGEIYRPQNLEELDGQISFSIDKIKKLEKKREIMELKLDKLESRGKENAREIIKFKEEIKKNEELITKKKEFVSERITQHIEAKGLSWQELTKTMSQGTNAFSSISGVVATFACFIM
jgi:vacuolar-type H+-ATPase subunit I/STV1